MSQYGFDLLALIGLTLGMLGSLYISYDFIKETRLGPILKQGAVAATLGCIGIFMAGLVVSLSALDAIFFPHLRVLGIIIGVIVWVIYGGLLVLWAERTARESVSTTGLIITRMSDILAIMKTYRKNASTAPKGLDRYQSSNLPRSNLPPLTAKGQIPWQSVMLIILQYVMQILLDSDYPLPLVITGVITVLIASVVGWWWAFFVVTQRGGAMFYLAVTTLLVGLSGFVYGLLRPPSSEPPIFSLKKGYVIIASLLTLVLSVVIGQLDTSQIPIFSRILIFMLVAIPVITAARGFAPFIKWKVEKQFEVEKRPRIGGIVLIFFAFALQLIQPIYDIWPIILAYLIHLFLTS